MEEILAFLKVINQTLLDKTTGKRLAIVILAMLAMAGRITILGISRWTEDGGSYRTFPLPNAACTKLPLATAFTVSKSDAGHIVDEYFNISI